MKAGRLWIAGSALLAAAPLGAQGRPAKTLAPAVVPVNAPRATRAVELWREDFADFPRVSQHAGESEGTADGLAMNAVHDQSVDAPLWDRGVLPTNVRLSVTVQFTGGPEGQGGGLEWGARSRDEQFTSFALLANGKFRAPDESGIDGDQAAPPIRRGIGSNNRLAVEIRPGDVTVLVNGQQVARWSPGGPAGYIGVWATPGARVLFSHLLVEQLR